MAQAANPGPHLNNHLSRHAGGQAEMPITENTNHNGLTTVYRGEGALLPQKDLIRYLREERGHSLNAAKAIAKECRTNKATAARELPSGWHQVLHEPKLSFERRLGFDPFRDSRGGGTQWLPLNNDDLNDINEFRQQNGLSAIRQDSHTEAVTNTH